MMEEKKKIWAIISYPFLPATTGGEISTLNLLNYMGEVYDLTVFTVTPYKDISKQHFNFKLLIGMKFTPWRYLNLFLLIQLIRKIRKAKSDFIFFDQPWLGWMIPFLRLFTGKRVFIRSNNLEYMRFKSMQKGWWSLLYMYEKFVYRVSNLVIFVSDADRTKAIYEFDLNRNKTLLTPYGVPFSAIPQKVQNARAILNERYALNPEAKLLLFFATMSYGPNYEAVTAIANKLYPLLLKKGKPFHVLLCGKNLPQEVLTQLQGKPEINYLGFVDDIETYIDGSDLMINPILSGGGVKTKAIDTLARDQFVLSTKTGAEGIDYEVCGNKLMVIEDHDWEAFATAIFSDQEGEIPLAFYKTYAWPNIISNLFQRLGQS